MISPNVPLRLPSGAPPPLALWSSFQCGLGLQHPSSASCRPSLRSQQGRKRLISALLLFHTAQVRLPPNCPWNPCAKAHPPSYGLANLEESGFNSQSQNELRFHHTCPNREELWIHAAMITMQSWSKCFKGTLPSKENTAMIQKYCEKNFASGYPGSGKDPSTYWESLRLGRGAHTIIKYNQHSCKESTTYIHSWKHHDCLHTLTP